MGCSSSKSDLLHGHKYPPKDPYRDSDSYEASAGHVGAFSRAISMPSVHPQNSSILHDFNIAPLSPHRYGINMKFPEQNLTNNPSSQLSDPSISEMLKVLHELDMEADPSAPPKKWEEVSSILDDLKPGLDRHFNKVLNKSEVKDVNRYIHTLDDINRVKRSQKAAGLSPIPTGPNTSNEVVNVPQSGHKGGKPGLMSRLFKSSSFSPKVSAERSPLTPVRGDRKLVNESGLVDSNSNVYATKGILEEDPAVVKDQISTEYATGSGVEAAVISSGIVKANVQRLEMKKREDLALVNSGIVKANVRRLEMKKREDPLEKFKELCPPEGERSVVLYTTSLRGVRKTFEDCNNVRRVLESFRVKVDERDIAMDQGFRDELKQMVGPTVGPVPRLFIKGRYIGGAEEVLQLHEEAQLAPLLEGMPLERFPGRPCDGCGNVRFIPCMGCNGSRKMVHPITQDIVRCPDCNENGLIQCPICS